MRNSQQFSWRWFSAASFMSQFLRVPVLLSLVSNVNSLSLYFLVTLASIPFQFLALEVLQYRNGARSFKSGEVCAVGLTLIVTIVHVFVDHGTDTLFWYLIFGISLLLYGAAIGELRATRGPRSVLFAEACTGIGGTLMVIAFALTLPEAILARAVVAALGLVNLLTFILLSIHGKENRHSLPAAAERRTGMVPLTGILISTQLERLLLTSFAPGFLTVISLAAGVVQAWRKIAMDDAIVFDGLIRSSPPLMATVIKSQLRRGLVIFIIPAALAVGGVYLTPVLQPLLNTAGILKSLDSGSIADTFKLICLYLTSLPAGIIMVNALRDGRLPIGSFGFAVLALVIGVECVLLCSPKAFLVNLSPWLVVGMTASLNLLLFRALMSSASAVRMPDYWIGFGIFLMAFSWTLI